MKPKDLIRKARRAERGVAAVEFAIMLPLMIALLSAPLYIGRVLWHYTAAQKAAHDAAQYLSTVPDAEMRSLGLISYSTAVAGNMIAAELADLNPGDNPPVVTILCDGMTCAGYTTPAIVSVNIQMRIDDPFFGIAFSDDGIFISSNSQMLYTGAP
jgi:Flp pilus assembly protein TadG